MSKPNLVHQYRPAVQAQILQQLHASPRPHTVRLEIAEPAPKRKVKRRRPAYDVSRAITHFTATCGLQTVPEYRFHPTRKWRFDLAWPEKKLALEVQGGIWIQGGHSRGSGMVRDFAKENAAAALGWRILKCQPRELFTPAMAQVVKEAAA